MLLVKFVQLIHHIWWIEFHKTPLGSSLSIGRWKTLAIRVVAVSSKGLQSLDRSVRLWISSSPGRPFVAAFLCPCCQCGQVFHKRLMTVNREQARDALATLLEVFAGPNYSGALRDGDLTTRLERCTGWVKAEASEAASLIESCVPHGKPMLAQAQQRLAVLESLKTLQEVAVNHFGPLDDPS